MVMVSGNAESSGDSLVLSSRRPFPIEKSEGEIREEVVLFINSVDVRSRPSAICARWQKDTKENAHASLHVIPPGGG